MCLATGSQNWRISSLTTIWAGFSSPLGINTWTGPAHLSRLSSSLSPLPSLLQPQLASVCSSKNSPVHCIRDFVQMFPPVGLFSPQIFAFGVEPSHNSVLTSNITLLNRSSLCIQLKSASSKQFISFIMPLFKIWFLLGHISSECILFFCCCCSFPVYWSCPLIECEINESMECPAHQCLEQCLTHRIYSTNICLTNECVNDNTVTSIWLPRRMLK